MLDQAVEILIANAIHTAFIKYPEGDGSPNLDYEWIAPDQSKHIAKSILLDLAANGYQIIKKRRGLSGRARLAAQIRRSNRGAGWHAAQHVARSGRLSRQDRPQIRTRYAGGHDSSADADMRGGARDSLGVHGAHGHASGHPPKQGAAVQP